MTLVRAVLAVFLLLAIPAIADADADADPVAAALSAADRADLRRVETYLNGIHTLKAGFDQTNPDGSVVSGELYMLRPGKMRVEYAPPAALLTVSDGSSFAVDDLEVNQVKYYPVASTPIWFLLRDNIRLSGDVTVAGFERGPGSLRVTAVQTRSPDSGAITLVFADDPLQLVKWEVFDSSHQTTSITLNDPEQGMPLAPSLFTLPQNKRSTAPSNR